jgi:ribosomal protein L40E
MKIFKKLPSPFVSNRLLKIKRLESNLEDLETELSSIYQEVGRQTYGFSRKEERLPKKLNKLCQKIWKIERKKTITLKEIDKVTARLFLEEKEPSVEIVYTNICPKCQIILSPDAHFCSECGSKASRLRRKKKIQKIPITNKVGNKVLTKGQGS